MASRIKLVVLYGGRSAEHDVSRVTASHVLRAVDPARYEVVPVAIDRDGGWHLATDVAAALAEGPDTLPDALPVTGTALDGLPTLLRPGGALATAAGDGAAAIPGTTTAPRPDPTTVVVLPLLHGPFGEDGTVQGLLEVAGLPYVGAGVLASSLAMDKAKSKEVFAHCGIPQAAWLAWRADQLPADVVDRVAATLGLPCFVKPSNLGSSVGVSKAHDAAELLAAIELALAYDEWVVVEEAISGREIELAVLGNTDPQVSVPGEIVPGAEFYDYEDKYVDGRAKLLVPAPLPAGVAARFQELALAAFAACRAEGMARVDFFYEEDGPARGPLLNEINTIPGFTPISMYPKLWQASGLPYPALIDRLVELALERAARRARRTRTER